MTRFLCFRANLLSFLCRVVFLGNYPILWLMRKHLPDKESLPGEIVLLWKIELLKTLMLVRTGPLLSALIVGV